jgi:hypothetical protein
MVLVVPTRQSSAGILVELKTPGFKMMDTCGLGVSAMVGLILIVVFGFEAQAPRIRINGVV